MATMAELLDSTHSRIYDDKRFDSRTRRRWIMEGARDIARRTLALRGEATIAVVAATQEYDGPADFIQGHRLEFTPTGQTTAYHVEYRRLMNMDEVMGTRKVQATSGQPEFFYSWGYPGTTTSLTLGLYPTPNRAGTARVYYYRLPAAIDLNGAADTSVVEIPGGWEDVAAAYCTYQAFVADGDPKWEMAFREYERKIVDMIGVDEHFDQPGTISWSGAPNWLTSFDDEDGW